MQTEMTAERLAAENAWRSIRMSSSAVAEIETSHAAASHNAKDMMAWSGLRLSPDAALLTELDTIVARSDDLARNNGIASGAERTLVDNVIGPRILLKPNPDWLALGKSAEWAADWSREVESLWRTFADGVWFDAGLKLTFHSAMRLVFRTIVSAGEALALPLWDVPGHGSRWKTSFQFIDPARLSNPRGAADTATLRGGKEIGTYGAATAYHIRKSHPGDLVGLNFAAGEWEKIPAYTPFGRLRVLHIYDPERFGQSRGKPIVTAVARQFKMLDALLRERLRQEVLNAMIFAGLETPLDQESMAALVGGDAGKDFYNDLKEWRVQMRGGAIIPLPPGTKLNPFTPGTNPTALESFATVMLRYVATGLNMPYELVFRDFSKTNYSSARAALLEAWRYFGSCRTFVIDDAASPIHDLWFEEAVNRDLIRDCTPAEFYANRLAWTRSKWVMAGRGWIDPVKEADAAKIRMEAGLSTLEDECAEQGRDWREVLEQRARERAYATSLGLPDAPGATRAPYASDNEPKPGEEKAA